MALVIGSNRVSDPLMVNAAVATPAPAVAANVTSTAATRLLFLRLIVRSLMDAHCTWHLPRGLANARIMINRLVLRCYLCANYSHDCVACRRSGEKSVRSKDQNGNRKTIQRAIRPQRWKRAVVSAPGRCDCGRPAWLDTELHRPAPAPTSAVRHFGA